MRLLPLLSLAGALALAACSSAQTPATSTATPESAAPSGLSATSAAQPSVAQPATGSTSCDELPLDSIWRADISRMPASGSSAAVVAAIGRDAAVHADFGAGVWDGGPIGIPVTTVTAGQARVGVAFGYPRESDPGPYPLPANAKIEGGPDADGDRHVILLDRAGCKVYELYATYPAGSGWKAGSGAIFDLRSNQLRRAGWTSADAAGLSVYAGLVRYEEVARGHIDHAIRVTAPRTRDAYIWPARHSASDRSDPSLPPMGLRLRLKSTVDISRLPTQARVVAAAMQKYGVIVADNGSAWYISGEPDERWSNDALHRLGALHGSDFEVVDVSGLMAQADSARVK